MSGGLCTLLGRERYRELMKAESFMLLPEWAVKWRHIMKTELGLSHEVARDLMRENRRELVYLDTGLAEIPIKVGFGGNGKFLMKPNRLPSDFSTLDGQT